MLVRHPRNRGRDAKPERTPGDGSEVSPRPSSPVDTRVNLPLSERKFVEERRGEILVTTFLDPPLAAQPDQDPLTLPLPDAPMPVTDGQRSSDLSRRS